MARKRMLPGGLTMHDMKALRRAFDYNSIALRKVAKSGKHTPKEERRRTPRYSYKAEGEGTLVFREDGLPRDILPNFPVIALSLSRSGVGLLANYEFKEGDIIDLVFRAPSNVEGQALGPVEGPTPSPAEGAAPSAAEAATAKRLRIRVTRVRRAGLKAFEIGAEFATTQ